MRFDTELPVPEKEAGWRSHLEGTAIAVIFVFATAWAASVQREWG